MGMWDEFKNISEYYDRLTGVLFDAPEFQSDYVFEDPPTLEKVFDGLRKGFYLVEKKVKDPQKIQELRDILENCYRLYKSGDKWNGGIEIQKYQLYIKGKITREEFDDLPNRVRRPPAKS